MSEVEIERQRRVAHLVEVWETAIGGALLLAAAAVGVYLFCKHTPAQLSGEADWTVAEELAR